MHSCWSLNLLAGQLGLQRKGLRMSTELLLRSSVIQGIVYIEHFIDLYFANLYGELAGDVVCDTPYKSLNYDFMSGLT